jgi:hypothetical protein
MKRRDLEHVIRAAADIADDDEIIVIGSQAILGQFPDAPAELCVSTEADVYPKNRPERTDRNANTRGATGWCLEAHDLVLSKYVAAREKDDRFVRAALAAKLVVRDTLLERLKGLPVEGDTKERLRRRIVADASAARS